MRRHRFLTVAGLAALGCTPGSGATEARRPADLRPLPPSSDARVCMKPQDIALEPRPANVLVLFDRSGTMGIAYGRGTRYSVAAELLEDFALAYDDKIRFGLQVFPGRSCGTGAAGACCVEPPSVSIGPGRGAALARGLAAAAPVGGNTPTASALAQARKYFQGLDDGVGNRYVLLATDGGPKCTADGRLGAPDQRSPPGLPIAGPCHDALAQVDALVADGVKVIVLGLGAGPNDGSGGPDDCLDDLAARGGAPRPAGRPSFYPAGDPAQLERFLQEIFGGVTRPDCLVELEAAPPDIARVQVFLDGQQIPRNRTHGWDFDPPHDHRLVRLFGASCQRVTRFQVTTIVVRHGCPTCVGESVCEE